MPSELTTKQKRDQRRAEKVAQMKREQARRKRNRLIGIIVSIVAAIAVVAIVVTLVVMSSASNAKVAAGSTEPIKGLKTFTNLPANHVDGTAVDYKTLYGMDPPAGGNHWSEWLNCGRYDQPQQNERAVHDLEHGAVWITYDPAKVTEAQITTMMKTLPTTYLTVSPYPNLPTPVVASAWGKQVQLTGTKDPRLASFITQFWRSTKAPEPTSPCVGGFDGPGKVG
ncbi:MAG: hypothetical protein JWR36_2673 [Glaciihabitans sp.]|nr:hypothetical protein [Glaciihabitans sp.]